MEAKGDIENLHRDDLLSARGMTHLPGLVLALCLALTAASTVVFFFGARAKDEARYSTGTAAVKAAIESKLTLHLSLLRSTKGFLDTDEHAERVRFTRFVESLGGDLVVSGLQGIGYSQVFKPAEREALIERMRREGVPTFAPYPQSDRDVSQAILYLVPQDQQNKTAIGYDMSSEEVRRMAIERARDTGEPAMTGKVLLVGEITEDKQAGFLIYLPIYGSQSTPIGEKARREEIKGFVYAPFRAGTFFKSLEASLNLDDIGFEVYDSEVASTNLLSQSDATLSSNNGSWTRLQSSDEIEVAGRKWVVSYATKDSFADQSIMWWSPFILLFGTVLSILLFLLVSRQGTFQEKIRTSAEQLIASERERQNLLVKEQEARRAAESASLAKDEFLSVVSHELRTPLNAMAGWTRVLKSTGMSQDMRDAALDKIERNLKIQSVLIEDLLAFSQMDSRGLVIEREQVDLTAVVGSVVSELEPATVEKGIVMEFASKDVVWVRGDGEKLRMAILKLTDNAIKFTEAGGRVDIALEELPDFARLVIRDSGVGIKQDFLPFVFDKFKQHDSSTTRRFGGLGLGLAISAHIVRTHGGTITAHSEGEGKGSEFVIMLPK